MIHRYPAINRAANITAKNVEQYILCNVTCHSVTCPVDVSSSLNAWLCLTSSREVRELGTEWGTKCPLFLPREVQAPSWTGLIYTSLPPPTPTTSLVSTLLQI